MAVLMKFEYFFSLEVMENFTVCAQVGVKFKNILNDDKFLMDYVNQIDLS